ncbi:hypothetical protein GEMRC1_006703 [Eukaryota sp. GEM-RC1]
MTSEIEKWYPLGDKFYAGLKLYDTSEWSTFNFNECIAAFCPCGGAIAICRHPTALSMSPGVDKGEVKVFTGSGTYITSISNREDSSMIRAIGWTNDEQLVVVTSQGTITIYSAVGELIDSFYFPDNMVREGIIHAVVWSTGVAALSYALDGTIAGGMFNSFSREGRFFQDFAPTFLTSSPTTFSYIGNTTTDGYTFVIGPDHGGVAILSLLNFSTLEHLIDLSNDPVDFCARSVSEDKPFLGLVSRSGRILVTSLDFSRILLDTTTSVIGCSSTPTSLAWIGNQALSVVFEDGSLGVVAVHNGNTVFHVFDYFNPLLIGSEIDGLRVACLNSIDFICKVPKVVEDTFKFGSVSPTALLYEAFSSFEDNRMDADEIVRCIGSQHLYDASNGLIEAAGFEFNVERQKKLLKAAKFGLLFLLGEQLETENLVDCCKKLKVVNHLKTEKTIGFSMTMKEFNYLTEETLVKRLCMRQQYGLAFELAVFLNQSTRVVHFVLTDWAVQKVKKSADNMTFSSLSNVIRSHVSSLSKGVSLSPIALIAFDLGHNDLAVDLISHEEDPVAQVSTLLEMKRFDNAMKVACEVADVSLLFRVFLSVMEADSRLLRQGQPVLLPNLLREYSLGGQLFGSLYKQVVLSRMGTQREVFSDFFSDFDLKQLFLDQGQPENAAIFLLLRSFYHVSVDERARELSSANVLLSTCLSHLPPVTSTHINKYSLEFCAKVIGDLIKWYTHDTLFFDHKTVNEAFRFQSSLGNLGSCKTISKLYEINDKKSTWLRLRSNAKDRNWSGLNDLAFNVCRGKPAIGFAPFAEVCIEENAFDEAVKYISRITDPVERVDLFLRCKRFDAARQCMSSIKDPSKLMVVKNRISIKDHKSHLLLDEMMGL